MDIFDDLEHFDLGDTALDVGAGWGSTTRYLLSRGLRVCAVDIDPGAVAYLKKALREFVKLGLLDVRLGAAETLPYGDKECDSAVSVAALHHFRDIYAALREMARVARRVIVVYDWTPNASGVTNPHNAEELRRKMEVALAAAKSLGYEVYVTRLWYRLSKIY